MPEPREKPVGKKRHAFSWLTDANYFAMPTGYAAYFIKSQLKPLPEPTADFTGKNVIVTGANVGLGLEAARHFARLGAAKVILACRDTAKAEVARADIEVSTSRGPGVIEAWQVDMGAFDSIREFCRRADHELGRLDVLVESAGVAIGTYVECDGGFESTIAVNVVGTFLMALLLLPLMRRTASTYNVQPRISIVSSDAHVFAKFAERTRANIFEAFRGKENMNEDRYNLSKLLVVLITRELGARTKTAAAVETTATTETTTTAPADHSNSIPVIINCLNPGFCRSELFRHAAFPLSLLIRIGLFLLGRTTEMGSRTLVAAASAGPESHGRYMDCCAVRDESAFARSEDGRAVGARVFDELLAVLEGVEPGIGDSLRAA